MLAPQNALQNQSAPQTPQVAPPNQTSFDLGSVGNPTSMVNLANIFAPAQADTGPAMPPPPDYSVNENQAQNYETQAYGLKPTQVRSNIGTKDLLALFGAALMGQNGGQFLQGYAGAKQQDQQRREQEAAMMDQNAQNSLLKKAAGKRAENLLLQKTYNDQVDAFGHQISEFNANRRAEASERNNQNNNATKITLANMSSTTKKALADVVSGDKELASAFTLLGKVGPELRVSLGRDIRAKYPAFANLDDDALMALTPKEQELKAKTDFSKAILQPTLDLLKNRAEDVKRHWKVNDQTADLIAKKIANYSDEAAAKISEAYARINRYDVMNQVAARGVDQKFLDSQKDATKAAATSVKGAIDANVREANAVRAQIKELNKYATLGDANQKADAVSRLHAYESVLKTYEDNGKELRKKDKEIQDTLDSFQTQASPGSVTPRVMLQGEIRGLPGSDPMIPRVTLPPEGGLPPRSTKKAPTQGKTRTGAPFVIH
jgi:hypothetical protein